MGRGKGSREARLRLKKSDLKATFQTATPEEYAEQVRRQMDSETHEIIQRIDGLTMNVINLSTSNAKLKMRMEQIGRNLKGEKIGEVNIKETFNGMLKSEELLNCEINADLYNYKRIVGEIEGCERYLRQKGFDSEQINSIKKDEFDITGWTKKRVEDELKKRGLPTGQETEVV